MKILITGALGHIGSGLIHSINNEDFEKVYMLDNMSTQRYSSLFNLPKNINYKFIEKDILEFDSNFLVEDIDCIIHLAAITDAAGSFNKSEEIEEVNYIGTKKVAEFCLKTDTKLFFPSTTSVYGSQSKIVDESCSISDLNPQSPYAEYKLKSEQMLKKMSDENGLKFVACRFGTIFGKSVGMRFHTAVNKFCWQAVMNQPLSVWKTALDQKRPYLGLNDAIDSIKFIIHKNIFDSNIYNIVSSNYTVREIVSFITALIPSVKVNLVESEIMNQLSYHVKSDKIKKMGFDTNDDISVNIKETIEQFTALLNNRS
tara:strand:+ start:1977 stop:2918 length:942 start_codon:yes stop_codon:yes gene_type:complete